MRNQPHRDYGEGVDSPLPYPLIAAPTMGLPHTTGFAGGLLEYAILPGRSFVHAAVVTTMVAILGHLYFRPVPGLKVSAHDSIGSLTFRWST